MDTYYDGSHNVTFGSKHAWSEFKLIPSRRLFVEPPSLKTNTINVPGANGVIDISEVPVGTMTYENRSGSWDFFIAHDKLDIPWEEHLALLYSHLHGRSMKCVLDDDRSYYYEGRFSISSYSPGDNWSEVSIDYDVKPFKYMIWTTTEPWEWNPFDLIYGEISQETFKNINISSTGISKVWTQNELGGVPVTPTFTVDSTDQKSSMELTVTNDFNKYGEQKFTLPYGTSTNPQIMFACPSPDNTTKIAVTGSGLISIDFRPGRL